MQAPHKRTEGDPGKLQAPDVVERRLALASENVQHVANQDSGLCAHCWLPETKQRAVACEEESRKKAEQYKNGGGCVDDQALAGK
ncbi:uncharacterized protein Z519_04812 [Cladophialophora bantiana CBS 173.52]|uniref:Uncharacterized protein n=1 Tax=Cladophialophora bantiana (strain ATCC 10958 / CBS 173.52 / CDC B-1940 / NIH 8579) TaxID=1442370 RepID=A0A0D2IDJ3_CLAB1|nr:uncharacterized protein Z519_04812 [Cladophialophora bantiana CBS 173.52]KIW94834.1 hypothetical protein Z519_04812 [Cladophialophora bantiana CBS 173.52]